ncbi:MAG TPA: Gfo/Idh/MocA family oxidoreductase, partial [Caldilineaceae bacterium]|nr:Gfo/Idh/MocA family oxidoreductase [Caldilineaceae bacterium]
MMTPIRMAQYGSRHGHALGKLLAMEMNPDVEVVGVFEPDPEVRQRRRAEGGMLRNVRWLDDKAQILDDPSIVAIASEGSNRESLEQTAQIVAAGKHVWYDKPAGEDWPRWQQVMAQAQAHNLYVQMGYMLRYHNGFRRLTNWAKSGLLGDIYSVRAHMSTWISPAQREVISEHRAGIFYDLAGHMLDQIVWLLGRPTRTTGYFYNHSGVVPDFADNTLGVLEYEKALAVVDIAAMEPRPMARRFEVYGSRGSAILLEPFEPGHTIRLCLEEADGGYRQGEQRIPYSAQSRQELYDLELQAFVAVLQ